jgi:hypothetical protein
MPCLILLVSLIIPPASYAVTAEQSGGPPSKRDTVVPKGVVKGQISAADTNLPLQGASVRLAGEGRSRTATTDASGHFEFAGVPAGRYTVRATRVAFLSMDYGEDLAAGVEGREIDIAAETVAAHIDIRLPRGAIIEGRVLNQYGEPVCNWDIRAMLRLDEEALYPLQVTRPRKTDDRGMFRLFGLPPGEYVVAIEPPQGGTAVRTYFPGVVDANLAQTVNVGISSQVTGIDVVVTERKSF